VTYKLIQKYIQLPSIVSATAIGVLIKKEHRISILDNICSISYLPSGL